MVLHVLVALQSINQSINQHVGIGMTETVDVFYQEMNYVTLLIFWLLTDVRFLLLHVSFIFDCLMYFFHYSVLRVRFYNKIIYITDNCIYCYCIFFLKLLTLRPYESPV